MDDYFPKSIDEFDADFVAGFSEMRVDIGDEEEPDSPGQAFSASGRPGHGSGSSSHSSEHRHGRTGETGGSEGTQPGSDVIEPVSVDDLFDAPPSTPEVPHAYFGPNGEPASEVDYVPVSEPADAPADAGRRRGRTTFRDAPMENGMNVVDLDSVLPVPTYSTGTEEARRVAKELSMIDEMGEEEGESGYGFRKVRKPPRLISPLVKKISLAVLSILLIFSFMISFALCYTAFVCNNSQRKLLFFHVCTVEETTLSPQLKVGDLAFVKEVRVTDIKKDDIITFFDSEKRMFRSGIVSSAAKGAETSFTTSVKSVDGMKNGRIDSVEESSILGRTAYYLPGIGKVVKFAKTHDELTIAACVLINIMLVFGIVAVAKKGVKPEYD